MSLLEEVKREMEEEKQKGFLEYKKMKMRWLIQDASLAATTLSLTDEKAKAIEAMTFEEYTNEISPKYPSAGIAYVSNKGSY